jgi:hypothetical protein
VPDPNKNTIQKGKIANFMRAPLFDYYQLDYCFRPYSNQSRAGKSLETGKGSEVQRITKFLFVLACSAKLLTGEFPVVEGYP